MNRCYELLQESQRLIKPMLMREFIQFLASVMKKDLKFDPTTSINLQSCFEKQIEIWKNLNTFLQECIKVDASGVNKQKQRNSSNEWAIKF